MTTLNAILLPIMLLFILLGFIAITIRIVTSVKTSKTGSKGLKTTEKAWLFQYDFDHTCVIFSTTKAGAIKKFYRDYGKFFEINKIMELNL
jgi:hypothetical protein